MPPQQGPWMAGVNDPGPGASRPHGQDLPVVARQEHHLSAKGCVNVGEIAQRSVEALQQLPVAHARLVPHDEVSGGDPGARVIRASEGEHGRDSGARLGRDGCTERHVKRGVKRAAAVQQRGRNAAGGCGDHAVSRGACSVQQDVQGVSFSCAAACVEEHGIRATLAQRAKDRVHDVSLLWEERVHAPQQVRLVHGPRWHVVLVRCLGGEERSVLPLAVWRRQRQPAALERG